MVDWPLPMKHNWMTDRHHHSPPSATTSNLKTNLPNEAFDNEMNVLLLMVVSLVHCFELLLDAVVVDDEERRKTAKR